MSTGFKKLLEFETAYGADSVEWCPVQGHEDVFVCGTYQLTEETGVGGHQTRIGKLYLFRLQEDVLQPLQVLDTPGVLDCKWAHRPVSSRVLLAVADARGRLVLYQLKSQPSTIQGDKTSIIGLEELWSYEADRLPGEEVLCLSLDWSTGRRSTSRSQEDEEVRIAVTDSKGRVTILQLQESSFRVVSQIKAHDHEAWITAFDYWNTDVFCSGGDDAKMNVYDLRASSERAVLSNRAHSAGVTSMHCNPTKEYSFVTGSYDEEVRYWDTRALKRPVSCLGVGGGVWRLKWEPGDSRGSAEAGGATRVLGAVMHGGFCLLDPVGGRVLARYEDGGHESLGYGADWSYMQVPPTRYQELTQESNARLTAQCSFYDKKLTLALVTSTTS